MVRWHTNQDPPLCSDLVQTELHQEHLAREKRLEDQLASEKHHAQALRTQNVYLKEKVEQMLQVMKAACASDKDHAYDEEVHCARFLSCSDVLPTKTLSVM
jgi:hypothetical protein